MFVAVFDVSILIVIHFAVEFYISGTALVGSK